MSIATEQSVLSAQYNAALEAQTTEQARRAPHVLMRPRIMLDGDKWCALYGDNLHDGVAGFGDTPEKAMQDFDAAWSARLTPRASRGEDAFDRFDYAMAAYIDACDAAGTDGPSMMRGDVERFLAGLARAEANHAR